MRRWAPVLAAAAVAMSLAAPAQVFAVAGVTVRDLAGFTPPEDGAEVVFEAEAIGEALRAPRGQVWVNVLAEDAPIGVVLERAQAVRIGSYGSYARTGDTVRIAGTFNRACDDHGGDRDVHAETLEVVAPGAARRHAPAWWKALAGVVAATVGLAGIRFSRRRRSY